MKRIRDRQLGGRGGCRIGSPSGRNVYSDAADGADEGTSLYSFLRASATDGS